MPTPINRVVYAALKPYMNGPPGLNRGREAIPPSQQERRVNAGTSRCRWIFSPSHVRALLVSRTRNDILHRAGMEPTTINAHRASETLADFKRGARINRATGIAARKFMNLWIEV